MKTILFVLLSGFAVLAVADDRGNSIMFSDKTNFNTQITKAPEEQSKGDYCMEMSRQIEKLKGSPQKRHALLKRYQAECEIK